MKVAIAVCDLPHQIEHADAMQQGLRRHGIDAVLVPDHGIPSADTVACWGWRIGRPLREAGKNVLVMERGYIDRYRWCSLGWNGLNGHAKRGWKSLSHRHALFARYVRPWNPTGDYVLLVGQVPGDAAVRAVKLSDWYAEAVRECARFGLPIMFRPHPVAVKLGGYEYVPDTTTITGNLHGALERAALVVTFNSNTGVDALLAGKPTIARDAGSMASIASRDWSIQAEPSRHEWVEWLASVQFSLDELRSGFAWDVVKDSQVQQ